MHRQRHVQKKKKRKHSSECVYISAEVSAKGQDSHKAECVQTWAEGSTARMNTQQYVAHYRVKNPVKSASENRQWVAAHYHTNLAKTALP